VRIKRTKRTKVWGDASIDPRLVNFREQATDLIPTGSFARLTGFANEHNEEIEAMAGGIDHAVGSGAHDIAKGGEQLKEDCGRMPLGVRGKGANGLTGEAVQSGFVQFGMRDGSGWGDASLGGRGTGRCTGRWETGVGFRQLGVLFGWKFGQESQKFVSAPFISAKVDRWGRLVPVAVALVMIRHYYGSGICTIGAGDIVHTQWSRAKSDQRG
jgi:hypothetical protein